MANTGKATQVPDANTTYERLANESDEPWQAFVMYRDMGPRRPGHPGRSLENVRVSLGKPDHFISNLKQWSGRFQWVKRARKYDDELEKKHRKVAERRIPYWEKVRHRSHKQNIQAAQKVRRKVAEMLARPIDSEEIRELNGREVVFLSPRWTMKDIGALLKVAAELEAGTIADATLTESEKNFDPEKASIEELRTYIAEHTGRKLPLGN